MSRRKPYTREHLSIYYNDIQSIIGLKPGEFYVVDNYHLKSLRVMLNRYLGNRFKETNVNYRSLVVSKDKAYFFRVDHSKNLKENNSE